MAEAVFNLEPYIQDAVDRLHVEVERRTALKVADALRDLGWICIPPTGKDEL